MDPLAIQTLGEGRSAQSWLAGQQKAENGGVKQGGGKSEVGMDQRANLTVQKGEVSLQVAGDEQQPSFSQRFDRRKG